MAKINVNWNRVMSVVEKVTNFLFNTIQLIACIILTVAIFAIALPIMYLAMLNPVMFALWAHICPKATADLLYERPTRENKNPNNLVDAWGTVCVGIICWAHRRLHGWMPRYFAWYAKKHFINAEPTAFCTDDVVRYIRSLQSDGEKTAFFQKLLTMDGYTDQMNEQKQAILNTIWGMKDMWLRLPLLEAKEERSEKFSTEEIKYICEMEKYDLLDAYMRRSTLSEDMLKVMVCCDNGQIHKRVYAHIIKHGVSAEFVAWAHMQGEGATQLVDESLTVYSQIVMTRQLQCTTNEEVVASWKKYLEKTSDIRSEAQKEFCVRQLVEYYKLGRELCEEAVFHFFSLATKDKNEVASVIFKHEGTKALKSERIKMLVKTNYWLNCRALELA